MSSRLSGSRCHAAALFLPLLATCLQTAAQPAPPSPEGTGQIAAASTSQEVTTRDAPVTFVSKVNLVPVSVVVRDTRGRAAGNLTKDDFKLFDNGKQQFIARFSIEKPNEPVVITQEKEPVAPDSNAPAGAEDKPAAVIASRFVAYVFDDIHLRMGDMYYVRTAAQRVLAAGLQPSERVAIYTTSGQVTEEFTNDVAKLQAALARVRPQVRAGEGLLKCPDISYFLADLIINKNDAQALSVATENYRACTRSPYITPQETQIAAQIELHDGERESRVTLDSLRRLVHRMGGMPGQRVLVLASPGFFLPFFDQHDLADIINQAARAKVIVNTLDARGLWAPPEFEASRPPLAGGPRAFAAYSTYMHLEALAQGELLGSLADGTGGIWIHDNNDLASGFQRLAAAPEVYYVLSFSPSMLKSDGKFHTLKVTLKEPKGFEVHARKGYYAPRRETDAAEQLRQDLEDAVFSRDPLSDLTVEVRTQFFKPSSEDAKLAVLARLDPKELNFHKQDDRNVDNLIVIAAVFDPAGNLVGALRKDVTLKLKDETLAQRGESGITIRSNFDVKPGGYVVRLVVRDGDGIKMAASNTAVEIP